MAKRKQADGAKRGDSAAPKKQKRADSGEPAWSKSKKKRMRRHKAKQKKSELGEKPMKTDVVAVEPVQTVEQSSPSKGGAVVKKSSALQQSFMARLTGSRFRELNEELYTTTSDAAFERFSKNPQLYEQYHDGFRHQVEQWPINPVNVIAKWLVTNFRKQSCVVADFGCGDAALAQKLLETKHKGACPFETHSFDLVASSDLVTACDMAHVPLENKLVNVAVFCLSLMGTNLADFLREAHRVLKDNGVLKIAEVRSRFESSDKKKDELQEFVQVLDKLGFKCEKTDRSNKMFVLLECKKNGKIPQSDLSFTAKPCIYKRR